MSPYRVSQSVLIPSAQEDIGLINKLGTEA